MCAEPTDQPAEVQGGFFGRVCPYATPCPDCRTWCGHEDQPPPTSAADPAAPSARDAGRNALDGVRKIAESLRDAGLTNQAASLIVYADTIDAAQRQHTAALAELDAELERLRGATLTLAAREKRLLRLLSEAHGLIAARVAAERPAVAFLRRRIRDEIAASSPSPDEVGTLAAAPQPPQEPTHG